MNDFKFINPQNLKKLADSFEQVEEYEESIEKEIIEEVSEVFKTNEMQDILFKQLSKSIQKIITNNDVIITTEKFSPQIILAKNLSTEKDLFNIHLNINKPFQKYLIKQNKILFYEIIFLEKNKIFNYTYPSLQFYEFLSLKLKDLNQKFDSFRLEVFVLENEIRKYIYVSPRYFFNN